MEKLLKLVNTFGWEIREERNSRTGLAMLTVAKILDRFNNTLGRSVYIELRSAPPPSFTSSAPFLLHKNLKWKYHFIYHGNFATLHIINQHRFCWKLNINYRMLSLKNLSFDLD